jgi:hypothetical protein
MKKMQWSLLVLTLANLALFVAGLTSTRPVAAQAAAPAMLRGRGLEIVDDQGRVRASITVMPAGTSAAGDRYNETVLLRLITEKGRPSVKLGASEEEAGISLAGPTGTKDTYIVLSAKGTSSSVRVREESGREQVLKP